MAAVSIVIHIDPRKILELSEDGIPDSVAHKIQRFMQRVVNPAMLELFGEAFDSAYVDEKYDYESWPMPAWECDEEDCMKCLHKLDCLASPSNWSARYHSKY